MDPRHPSTLLDSFISQTFLFPSLWKMIDCKKEKGRKHLDAGNPGRVRGELSPTQTRSTLNRQQAILPPESSAAPRRNRGWKRAVERSETGVRHSEFYNQTEVSSEKLEPPVYRNCTQSSWMSEHFHPPFQVQHCGDSCWLWWTVFC